MNYKIIPDENLGFVTDIPGYTPNISRLICMMNYARIEAVNELTVDELDILYDDESNSIGALLLHIASIDNFFRILTFEERDMTKEEIEIWKAASELGDLGRKEIKVNDLNYYLEKLDEERNIIYELFKNKNDEWLDKESIEQDFKSNNHHAWFNVFEDEINHRGQIS